MAYEGQLAEMVKFQGFKDDRGDAYYARPTRAGRFAGVVVIHHLPGWDEWIIEVTRKFAHYGYAAIAPHLYFRDGPGSPDDIGARVRAAGGVADEQAMGDIAGAIKYLRAQPHANGKVGIIGFCCGGSVIVKDKKQLDAKRPVAPIDLTDKITSPLLGIFGNEDKNPDIAQVNETEALLKRLDQAYEFHRYDGVGHAFFNDWRGCYKAPQALDGWQKVFGFYQPHLASA